MGMCLDIYEKTMASEIGREPKPLTEKHIDSAHLHCKMSENKLFKKDDMIKALVT